MWTVKTGRKRVDALAGGWENLNTTTIPDVLLNTEPLKFLFFFLRFTNFKYQKHEGMISKMKALAIEVLVLSLSHISWIPLQCYRRLNVWSLFTERFPAATNRENGWKRCIFPNLDFSDRETIIAQSSGSPGAEHPSAVPSSLLGFAAQHCRAEHPHS